MNRALHSVSLFDCVVVSIILYCDRQLSNIVL